MTTRIRRMVDFAASDIYRQLRPDAHAHSANKEEPTNSTSRSNNSNGAGPKQSQLLKSSRVIRRIVPKDTSPSTLVERTGPPSGPMFEPEPPDEDENEKATVADTPPSDGVQDINLQRLHVAAIRANADQAEVWLKLGEMLQNSNQSEQAASCIRRAQILIEGSNEMSVAGQLPFAVEDLPLVAGQSSGPPANSNSNCPKCNTVNPVNARFCYQCQAVLRMGCLHCGVIMPAHHPNCTACGQNQVQVATNLKAEAEMVRQTANKPLPPRGLAWWEIFFSLMLVTDFVILLIILARQTGYFTSIGITSSLVGGSLLALVVIVSGIIWFRRRVRRYWQRFDETEMATRRYNEIADVLARHNITLDPPHLTPKDPWRWT